MILQAPSHGPGGCWYLSIYIYYIILYYYILYIIYYIFYIIYYILCLINHYYYFLPQSRSKVAFPDSPRNSTREYCVSQAQQAQHRIQPCWQSSWDLLGERGAHIPWVLIKNQVAKGFGYSNFVTSIRIQFQMAFGYNDFVSGKGGKNDWEDLHSGDLWIQISFVEVAYNPMHHTHLIFTWNIMEQIYSTALEVC